MKTMKFRTGFILALGVIASLITVRSFAADTNSIPAATPSQPSLSADSSAVAAGAPVKLPYGVDDVLKLSRAQISEDIIVNYVQTSGTIYSLAPEDIVYLHGQGVSDRVVTTMLDQRKRATDAAAQQAPVSVAAVQSDASAPTLAETPAPVENPAPAPTYSVGAADYSEPAPAYTEPAQGSSTVYVISYPAASAAYYGYYPSYPYYAGPYYGGYYRPVVSCGFRYGGHWGHYGGHPYYGGHYGHHH